MWISVDPGQVHVGVAAWEGKTLKRAFEMSPDQFKDHIKWPEYSLLVIESFSLHSPKFGRKVAQEAVDTIELIGFAKALFWLENQPVVTQQPAVRTIAMKGPFYRDLKMDEKWGPVLRNDHIASAVCHGLYYKYFGKGKK